MPETPKRVVTKILDTIGFIIQLVWPHDFRDKTEAINVPEYHSSSRADPPERPR
jgi:hypothetical protein